MKAKRRTKRLKLKATPLWERACSRWDRRDYLDLPRRLHREQARSHKSKKAGPDLEITPQLLRHGQGYNRRSFGTQHPWAKACRLVAGGLGQVDFVIGQAAFGADQKR